ncbi:hypothetical protein [Clostridium tertium]|uniref:hypothetical protein n=1 Tax=Clostridium tertium TaxID=1559 RepID=UPI0023B302C6|nr:hypothetical protein [Clostridium tertium]
MKEKVIQSISLQIWNKNKDKFPIKQEDIQNFIITNTSYKEIFISLSLEERFVLFSKIKLNILDFKYKEEHRDAFIKH